MINIKIKILSNKKSVIDFLNLLQSTLNSDSFNINSDFFINKKENKVNKQFTTRYTLLDLDYDSSDVVERLEELTIDDYSETLVDRDNNDPPLLYVFGILINGKQIYIKIKCRIKKNGRVKVVCVSFHYAESEMSFPYA